MRACIELIFPAEEGRGAPTACFSKEPCVSSSSLVRFSRFRFLMDQPANVRRWAMGGSETSPPQEIWRDDLGEAAEPQCTPKTAKSLPTGGGATVGKALTCPSIETLREQVLADLWNPGCKFGVLTLFAACSDGTSRRQSFSLPHQ